MQNTPNWEALKETARWIVLFVVSWVITEVLKQITLVPATYNLKVWVFTFAVPVQFALQTALTLAGRYTDKLLFERSKNSMRWATDKPKGLLPF